MVPAMLILTFAWTLSDMCRIKLGSGEFVGALVGGRAAASIFLPAVFFLIAMAISFSTGTSWGTFSILIPIVVSLYPSGMPEIMLISIAASLAGSVFGDHISIISDTTIMSATGSQCNVIVHIATQTPYAVLVAVISFVCYIIAGFVQNPWIVLPISLGLLLATLLLLRLRKQA
jgi:Na+/H+ antiporter NhaC